MSPYPEGTLVKEQSRAEVYRITGGRKLHIPSAYAFDALGSQWRDVVEVADGSLAGIPTDTWQSQSATPGSVVWAIDAADPLGDRRVHHPLPLQGSREWRVWGRPLRTRELRGWLTMVDQRCSNANDPDWHWQLVLDLGWARAAGIDVNFAMWAGNVLTNGIHDPGTSVRARCGIPQIHCEVSGWPINHDANRGRREPPDWIWKDGTKAAFANDQDVKWPFDPRLSATGDPLIAAPDALRSLQGASCVRVYGGLVTDNAHIDDDPEEPAEVRAWKPHGRERASPSPNKVSGY